MRHVAIFAQAFYITLNAIYILPFLNAADDIFLKKRQFKRIDILTMILFPGLTLIAALVVPLLNGDKIFGLTKLYQWLNQPIKKGDK